MRVAVVDWVRHEADITAAQALAYCRRVLAGWQEGASAAGLWASFRRDGVGVEVPLRDTFGDWPRCIAGLCGALVELGIVSQPSEALRGMAAEKAGEPATCPACEFPLAFGCECEAEGVARG